MKELAVYIDNSIKTPVYQQIYEYIRQEIRNGNLSQGTMLPSSRALALHLQVSRSTVLLAYDQLLAEGYIESMPQKGYQVLESEEIFTEAQAEPRIRESGKKKKEYEIVFSPDGIESEYFPVLEWRKIARQVLGDEDKSIFDSGDFRGEEGLRTMLARYLRESRGVHASAGQIILGAGNENLLTILKMLLPESVKVGMENPVYQKSYRILKGLGCQVVPVEMDRNGISVTALTEADVDIAYVTPSHQYPMGTVMSIGRRGELLSWADSDGRYIIEDDYDSEFRYKGKPIPSLQGSDLQGKVIYIGTFSKSVSPAIRISYMVLPEPLFQRYEKKLFFFSNTVSRLDQKILELFMKSGGFERHLNRMRTIYKMKHDRMLGELKTWSGIEIFGEHAGAHMLLRIHNGMGEEQLVKKARDAGIRVYGLSDYFIGESKKEDPVIILGYARIGVDKIMEGLTILKQIWEIR